MGNKEKIIRECNKLNRRRSVETGDIDDKTFFENVRGDLLLCGTGAEDTGLKTDLICAYMHHDHVPTIVFSSHDALFHKMKQRQDEGKIAGVMFSWPEDKNYHLFYGMSNQQFIEIIRMAAEYKGYGNDMDHILTYASAIINIIETAYPPSLPAMTALLSNDDDFISQYAQEKGLPSVIIDNIRSGHEAGISFRRICEYLQSIFAGISDLRDSRYNIQSGAIGSVHTMMVYQASSDQKLMNKYLKEELFAALGRVQKIRVILDEPLFTDENDELLDYLFKMKMQKKVELVLVSVNAKKAVCDRESVTRINGFSNIVMFRHDNPALTEEISKLLFSTYPHAYPVPGAGKPPALFGLTLMTSLEYHIATEDRLRVRAEDLYVKAKLFGGSSDLLAVKSMVSDKVFLIEAGRFLPNESGELVQAG